MRQPLRLRWISLIQSPLSAGARALVAADPSALETALTGGDDYELLATVPEARAAAFAEMCRLLKPGGQLYATTVGENNLAEIPLLVQGLHPALASWQMNKFGFTLENGTVQLARWFDSVALRRYEDSLCVTAVEPLVRYILSAEPQHDADLERRVRERVQQVMVAHGGQLHIRKDAGMFVCVHSYFTPRHQDTKTQR